MTRIPLLIGIILFFAGVVPPQSVAHINNTSLSLKGGETFTAGQKVTLTWKISIIHNRMHLIYFSESPEKAWQLFDSVPEKAGTYDMKYEWVVPSTVSSKARIRVYQSFAAKPGDKSDDYTIISKEFSITPAVTGIGRVTHTTSIVLERTSKTAAHYDLSGRSVDNAVWINLKNRHFTARRLVKR